MTTKKTKPYKIKIEDQQSLHEPSATYQYNTDQIAALKLEALEEIMDLNQTELLRKIIKYLKRSFRNHRFDVFIYLTYNFLYILRGYYKFYFFENTY